MEIVAKKYPCKKQFAVILASSLVILLSGVGLFLAYVMYMAMFLMLAGLICTALMIFVLVRFNRLPSNLITYENGVLTFPKGITLRPEEITSLDFTVANAAYKSVSYNFGYGMIKAETRSGKIKVLYAADVQNAVNRLREIINEARYSK